MQDNPNTLPQASQNQNPAQPQGGRGSRGGFRGRGGGTASHFFLSRRSVEDGFGWFWESGEHGLYVLEPPLSHPLQFPLSHSVQGKWLLRSHLCPHGLEWAFHSRGLSALAGLCRSTGGV